ncbi:MAG: hypothetical protein A3H02_02185 [Candidatus Niyogibacteria bacterium RIFCSPLOWO2_12_FULL_41_13]|uniref:Uncharacterized protein n=1 Tax=Candidatus Niyogibacteria bacterium RIFCSPLOWO2_12_FULL_41_13 TaxID=1801726 RepID=A0A1G2F4B3_9BACT|nr:MAG: hypothetical protein A3H02_02185 [Candidatus Niyogibacteria bacterium RIFCSPLOWO2_12_FULL_41_13]
MGLVFFNFFLGLCFIAIGWLIEGYVSPLPEPIKVEGIYIPPNSKLNPIKPFSFFWNNNKKRADVPSLASLEKIRGDKQINIFYDGKTLCYFIEFQDTFFSYAVIGPSIEKAGLKPVSMVIKDGRAFIQLEKDRLSYFLAFCFLVVLILIANIGMRSAWKIIDQEHLTKKAKEKNEEAEYARA